MASKMEYYAALAEKTAGEITGSLERWTDYLKTASRLYRYSYPDQLMIFAQRPDATACAEFDLWNDRMNRYIKRGSKGIALIDLSRERPRLRYVFDVSDTGERRNSRPVELWKMRREHEPSIQDALEKQFGMSADIGPLEDQILAISEQLAADYWKDHKTQIFDIVENSFLEDYDEYNVRVSFQKAASVSICYELFSRCFGNPDDFYGREDFEEIFNFNTQAMANVLGTAVNEMAAEIFKEVERGIENFERNKERSQNNERDDLRAERRLSDSEHSAGSNREQGTRQIWENEESIPAGEQHSSVQSPDSDGETVSASVGSTADSNHENGTGDDPADSEKSGTGQETVSDGMGTAHEYAESTGRGNDSGGTDYGINPAGLYEQLSFILPTEAEQIEKIDQREAEGTKLSAFSFAQNEITHLLQIGINADEGRKIVAMEFMKQKPIEELVDVLKRVYHGGFGLKEENGNIAAWYAEDGIHLAKGNAAEYVPNAQVISWREAARQIGELLEEGQYATNVELIEAPDYERKKLAEAIWYLYHDFSETAHEANYMPTLRELETTGFPEQTVELSEKMKDSVFLHALRADYLNFMAAYDRDHSLVRFHYHKPDVIQKRLEELDLPLREYQSKMTMMPLIRQFITDDEINHALSRGSGFAGGKGRITKYWQEPHSPKEKADFLKNEYGTGGHSHAISGTSGSGEDHDAKGIRYKKSGCDEIHFSWIQVASRIDKLIREDIYLTKEEKAERDRVEEAHEEPTETISSEESEIWEEPDEPERIEIPEEPSVSEEEVISEIPAVNYHITNEQLGVGGPKQKYERNIAAIQTLFKLEEENRNATAKEQEVLSNYVGWGGLADAFDPNKDSWAQEYRQLKGLLSEEEYAAARASTLNAHYTSPVVIQAMYDAMEQMGFEAGNILEPSMGVGNFFGMLPPQMQNSRLYGVELDSITGRIAKKLYPNADITVAGFETTDRRDFFDLAVGNVPFGNYKVADKPYDKLGFSIHNYFFAKALDQVRPGGVIAFVTSRFTMDAKSPDARQYIAQRAELLGAIRLPNDAFRANAGADVVSDILFLKKREHPVVTDEEWVHLGQTPDGLAINSYFLEHPEMILGEIAEVSTPYGKMDLTVKPVEGKVLSEQLAEAIKNIHGTYESLDLTEPEDLTMAHDTIPADPNVKNFSFAVMDGEIYFRENSIMRHVELSETATGRVKGMVELRQIVGELMDYQLNDYSDEAIKAKQLELNEAYDRFNSQYGLINSRANNQAFAEDSSYYLLCSLENLDENGNLESKADMFTQRTIRPERKVTSVDTPAEALAISIGERGKVDLAFMSDLLGEEYDENAIVEELTGVIFRIPEMLEQGQEAKYVTADEYLSGNVREKLNVARIAGQTNPIYQSNVEALTKAQPKDLDASEIDVRLGATWIGTEDIQDFMEETFETPFYLRRSIEVKFSPMTAEWQITGKSAPSRNDVHAYTTYGTGRANAYKILEDTLNLRDIRIYDTIEDADGKQKHVLNKRETMLAQQKQQSIKDVFQNWIWENPYRRERLTKRYNELFNSTRPREYDGSHIRFGGMNPEIRLREHQLNAIAHVLYGGNTLLAHEVGAGKTFEMAASAMEAKRLGLCQKSLFVVPNHLTLQWANEFLHLYPSAKLLVASKKDFETANRKKFCARIATGEYDAVIIGHSQFEKIPISPERQERMLREQIDEIEDAISEMKYQRGERFSIKQMEKTRKSLQARLDKLLKTDKKDDVVSFEQLGVDRLFVDEAHSFKNLFLYTKMRNVAGLSTSEAQKSSDMFMKCQYMDELTGGRGIVFATGTPISNSMTEMYTMMRYLQYGTLKQKGLTHFDCWASTFGETSTAIELAPEGTGYRARTRFAKFFNLPELMNMFKEVADIKTSDQLNLPVPEAKFETVVIEPSEHQKEIVSELSERAATVHSGMVDPSVDNMLKITSDGRKLGLDQRLMNPLLPDVPDSKLNVCVKNVLEIWEKGSEDKLTQLVFCDLSTPKKDGSFNVYDDVRTKLLHAGIPETEIAFIHDADTEAKKKELFAKVRTGQVRILIGSTQKMGAGTNVQDRLKAVHHLDVGWRPADMTQRNGRIIRQGNRNKEVLSYQYVTEGTFDAYLWQTLENKQKFISQIMTSKSPVRSCEDIDEQVLSYAEIKALCAGDPKIKEKMDLDVDVARLKVLKADHQSQKYRLEDKLLKYFPAEIERTKGNIKGFEEDCQIVANHPLPKEDFVGIEIQGKIYTDKAEAGEMILAACKAHQSLEPVALGSYRGFQMELAFDSFLKEYQVAFKGKMTHRVNLGTSALGNLTRLDNALASIPEKLDLARQQLDTLYDQQAAAQVEVAKPFPQEEELAVKSTRLAELDVALNMDEKEDESKTMEEDSDRQSVLAELKTKTGLASPSHPKKMEEVR